MMHSKFTGMVFEGLRLPQIRINNDTTTASGGYRAVKLTYRDSNFSAIALLCDEKKHKLDASACLNSLDIEDVLSGAGWRDISQFDSINLPRFEVEVKQLSVKKALQAMNVTEPFSGDAKFRKLSYMPLKIDDIYHSSVVKVDEEGTEAAAVNVFNLGPTAAPGEMLEFNRPFVFLVYDEEQATVMFMGVVNRPRRQSDKVTSQSDRWSITASAAASGPLCSSLHASQI
uniref:Serpin domain-containing protein n=1 Tax=Tetradesmus obliquus TaxID=3088 RepID=A0A383V6N1_TETOB|eukprot:jgi/Sobl393_1/8391/SZX61258.1